MDNEPPLPRSLLICLLALLVAGIFAAPAAAHPQSTSAVLLDVLDDRIEGELQLPIDRLEVGVQRQLDARNVLTSERAFLARYTAEHIRPVREDGRPWAVRLGEGRVEMIDRHQTEHLVYPLELVPPDGRVTRFDLGYDVIIGELVAIRRS